MLYALRFLGGGCPGEIANARRRDLDDSLSARGDLALAQEVLTQAARVALASSVPLVWHPAAL